MYQTEFRAMTTQTKKNPNPAPIELTPTGTWDGNDGQWSTFLLRAGTPEQDFRVLPTWVTSSVILPGSGGCVESDPPDCGPRRGVNPSQGHQSSGFQANWSSTWDSIGIHDVGFKDNLGGATNAAFGRDNIGINGVPPESIILKDQVIELAIPSFMTSLKREGIVPSLSFGYTAGASYASPQTVGSLVLGGFDEGRFTPKNTSAPLDKENLHLLGINISSITTKFEGDAINATEQHVSQDFPANIDSTVTHLWLPVAICHRIQRVFGLSYNEESGFYTIDGNSREKNLRKNTSITIQIGSPNGTSVVNITLPYAALDLQISEPYYKTKTRYFPIRRSQGNFTLGRVFLQSAYVIVDYERGSFSVHQTRVSTTTPQKQIVSIQPPEKTNSTERASETPKKNSVPRSTPAIFAFVLWFFLRRRKLFKTRNSTVEIVVKKPKTTEDVDWEKQMISGKEIYELSGSEDMEIGGTPHAEIDGTPQAEIEGTPMVGIERERESRESHSDEINKAVAAVTLDQVENVYVQSMN
ncbi:aspartic peptidase domain-containing protein [Dendryphion nanum]|uniref:Aspartic peptidase domain-containing protein n=1 Tax=Dendryphion nanum TaxID=256645 RepID=A0A9P9D1R1_9PLEO|nr:aspartic peptidase domain-containing protein [Dendryphion nanum]